MILLTLAIILLILMGVLAPYETLSWWAGWYDDRLGQESIAEPITTAPSQAEHFIIYLTGVGGVSPEAYSYREQLFLKRLARKHPEAAIVDDIFPYSVSNRALTGDRFFGRLWRFLRQYKKRPVIGSLMGNLINLRNIWQVLVAADHRYGPFYHYASAQQMLYFLLKHGYRKGSRVPITLIGYSGAAQIAVGVVPHLKQALDTDIHVISLAGTISSIEGLDALTSLTHIYGSKDRRHQLADIFFPQRWGIFYTSYWNRAKRAGKIHQYRIGPMVHTGANAYLDHKQLFSDGQSYLDKTIDVVSDTLSTRVLRHDLEAK